MFSLIWYFGLISFVVSAHFNNDTLHGGYKLNISTTMSTLPSTTIPVAKDCVLEMKESEISEIVELFNNDRVHVVDIHVSFSNTTHDKELSDFRVKLLNPIGREILYSLERWLFQFVTWTLNAGIRNYKLHVNESQNDCVERQKNATDFAFENMQNIVRSVNLATNYEVWYSFKETSSGKVHQICCHITKHNLPKCNLGCSKGNSFLYASEAPWDAIYIMMFFFAWFYLMSLLHVFLFRTEFALEYPKYYKLEESRFSPSFIFFKITFKDYGRVVSFIRPCVLLNVFVYFTFLLLKESEKVKFLMLTLVGFSEVSFLISYHYKSRIANSSILHRIKEARKRWSSILFFKFLLPVAPDVNEFRPVLGSGEFADVIKVATLPVNKNYWREKIKKSYARCASFIGLVSGKFKNPILKILALCTCYVLAVLISALSVSILFLILTILAIIYPMMYLNAISYLTLNLEYNFVDSRCPRFCAVPHFFHVFCLLLFFFFTVIVTIFGIQSFLLGLFLNLIYFIPYFAFFSVLTFYCCKFWKTMEEKYLVLKRLIYEACRDIEHVNNGCIPNKHPKREGKVLPVVSKEVYDKIREKLLPYHTNLFYFGLKIFCAFAFSFGILKLIEMLNEFNVTGLVQVITTASLGVMPNIFNMIALKTSEENKKSREENLKLNVKYMLEDLLRGDPKLARTVLIIQQNNDSTTAHPTNNDDDLENPEQVLVINVNGATADVNVQDSENVQVSESDMNATNNDDAEGSELTDVLIPQENDTTADENVHDSEKTACLSKLLARLCCNNDATTEHSSDNDEDTKQRQRLDRLRRVSSTTADENVQDSENVQVSESDMNATDNDDAEGSELTERLITQESKDTTADENVHDSKKNEGLLKLLAGACCCNDATTEENFLDSEHPWEDDDDIEDPELTRTLLEINHTTAHEIDHDSEHNEAWSGLNPPDNDNVEDLELTRTALITEGIDTAADENVSENIQGTSDLNPPDRDDGEELPIVIVHAQKSRDVTTDENVQDSEHIEARSCLNSPGNDDTKEFPMIVHAPQNNDTTADENLQYFELVEVRCDNDDVTGDVEENIVRETMV